MATHPDVVDLLHSLFWNRSTTSRRVVMLWMCSAARCGTDPQHLDVSSCRGSVLHLYTLSQLNGTENTFYSR